MHFYSKTRKNQSQQLKQLIDLRPKKRDIENRVDASESDSHPKLLTFQVVLDMSSKILDFCEEICLAALRRAI